jgi:cytoskeleton protein RodZ
MSDVVVTEGPSAGVLLRRAREAAGLHVAALAVSLKVPVRKLEALEEDRYDLLPDAVFTRALASSVCRTLKIDPQPVLERLPQTAKPRLIQDHDGINAPFRSPSDGVGPHPWLEQLSKPVFLAVFALLLGAVVLIFLPDLRREETVAAAPNKGADSAGAPMAQPVVIQSVPPAAEPAAAPAPTVTQALAPSTPQVSPTAVVTPAALPPVNPAPTVTNVAATAPGTGLVVFRTKGPSWIEVTDGKGVVTLRKLMTAGESAGASGALPLTVTVGSSNNTAVEVRGKSFDLAPVSRDNVARFEVK